MTPFTRTGTTLGPLTVIVILGGVAAEAQQPPMGPAPRAGCGCFGHQARHHGPEDAVLETHLKVTAKEAAGP